VWCHVPELVPFTETPRSHSMCKTDILKRKIMGELHKDSWSGSR